MASAAISDLVVRDANGVIPGVTVTLTNEATSVAREVQTNDVGQYSFPAVPPGTYSLKTSLTGYKTYESKGLTVGTQQFITLDVTLELGRLEENITVTGQSPLIDTANASHSASLDREALESLPAPGRNAFMIGVNEVVSGAKSAKNAMTVAAEKANAAIRG